MAISEHNPKANSFLIIYVVVNTDYCQVCIDVRLSLPIAINIVFCKFISSKWDSTLRNAYLPMMNDTSPRIPGVVSVQVVIANHIQYIHPNIESQWERFRWMTHTHTYMHTIACYRMSLNFTMGSFISCKYMYNINKKKKRSRITTTETAHTWQQWIHSNYS